MSDVISVVVPIYNVEKYLDRCISSIVNQTYRNLQIILVDDGSTDACPALCDAWARRDERIMVIHKENFGLGMARNTGIEHAAGKYICFVDSDDFLDLGILEKAYARAEQTGSDVTIFGLALADEEGRMLRAFTPQVPQEYFCGAQVRDIVLPDLIHDEKDDAQCKNLSLSVCVCLFRMDLIERANWRLVSEREIISEDSYSVMELYRHVNSVAILPEIGYYYCYNQSSVTRSFRQDRYEKIKYFYEKTIELCRSAGYGEVVQERVARCCLAFIIGAMKQMAACDAPAAVRKARIKEIVQDQMLQDILHSLSIDCYKPKVRILFSAMRRNMYRLVYLLVRLQAAAQ